MRINRVFLLSSFITFLSRISGFIRDILIASVFTPGLHTDAFFVSFKIPNLLRKIFAEGAFSQVFIPILIEYKKNHNDMEINIFISCVFRWLVLFLILITIIGILIAPILVFLISPGFIKNFEQFQLTVSLIRILFPYIILISIASLFSSILHSLNQFFISLISPILLNISMIFFILFITPKLTENNIISLAWSVLIGGLMQLYFSFIFLKRNDISINYFQIKHPEIFKILFLIGPAIFGISINQILTMLNTAISSFLSPGSISWMYYADRIVELPMGILGVSIINILLPYLSKSISFNKIKEYSDILCWGLQVCFLLVLPSSIILITLSRPLIITLFQYQNFSDFDVIMTQKSLIGYAIGLTGFILVKILTLAFYSYKNFRTPIYYAAIMLLITQCMNILFVTFFQHAGLSLSISITAYIHAGLLYWKLYKKKYLIHFSGWSRLFLSILFSSFIMFIIILFLSSLVSNWMHGGIFYRLIRMSGIILISIIVYFSALFLLGIKINHILSFRSIINN
ncbi:MAG: murein biosynthesis integral membrane protein MurJ [Wigglesworthia glossinidia]|nr:murein biosynthesis integral membrane protein MurJ [Wigglesworthia glossinidia]